MKYMGWGWKQLCEAPPDIVLEIIDVMNEEAAEIARINNK